MITPGSYRFGPYRLDRAAYRLVDGDRAIELSPKALDLLLLLVERAGSLVTKDDILNAVWPDVAVTDNALTQVVSDLRHALGDSSTSPRYLETVPRRGYRFIAPVETTAPGPAQTPALAPDAAGGLKTIAVLDFANVAGEADVAWLAAGIAETVTNDLRVIRDLRVIDRSLVARLQPDVAADQLRTAGLDLVVVGSFQRAGDQLRITARLTDVATREALANAKADGPMAEVFALQDAIVMQLATGLQVRISPAERARMSARETSSIEAYRALTEGRIRLEALDPAEIPAAIGHFERALALDPRYALAHVGLAHARFWQFQASRARNAPEMDQLRAAVAHARRAIEIDPELAEAHSALGFVLASLDQSGEAVAAARRAVALEPGNWRHLFRLGMAAWGEERLACLQAVVAQYPTLPYAYLGLAMVRIARRDLQAADRLLHTGLSSHGRAGPGDARFPASGLHALRGLIRLAEGDSAKARAAFDRELEARGSHLFAEESARDAYDGHGHVRLAEGDAAGSAAMFEAALARYPDHPRSLIGLAAACRVMGAHDRAEEAMTHARKAFEGLGAQGRATDAALAGAAWQVASNRPAEAATRLVEFLKAAPPGSAGWIVPVDPFLAGLRKQPAYENVLALLADRAR